MPPSSPVGVVGSVAPPPFGGTTFYLPTYYSGKGLRMIVLVSLIILLRGFPCFHVFRMVHPYIPIHSSLHLYIVWLFHLGMVFSFRYGLLVWVWCFHLSMVFSFGHDVFIWVWCFHWVWCFLMGMVFSFGYGVFIWVYMVFSFIGYGVFIWVYMVFRSFP